MQALFAWLCLWKTLPPANAPCICAGSCAGGEGNPKSHTLNPKSETRNPKPETRNPRTEALNLKP